MIIRPWKRIRDLEERLRAEREAHAATAARHGVAETLRQAAEARANELLQEILALKRDGFHPPEPPPPAPPPAEDLPAEVRDALAEVARPGSDVWYSELALAQADLAAGKQPAEVAQAILRGGKYRPW